MQKESKKRRAILQGCIFFSLLAHAGAITFIQKQSLWFYSGSKNAPVVKSAISSAKSHDATLKKAFSKTDRSADSTAKTFSPLREEETEMPFAAKKINAQPSMDSLQEQLLSKVREMSSSHLLINSEIHLETSSLPVLTDLHQNLLNDFPYPYSLTQIPEQSILNTNLAHENLPDIILARNTLAMQEENRAESLDDFSSDEPIEASHHLFKEEIRAPEGTDSQVTFDQPLAKMPTLGDLDTASVGENFDIDLTFMPKEGEGYIFALTLIPKPNASFPKLPQNYYFVIDKSNAIQKNRLKTTVNAVYKSLSFLQEGDMFNILAYDGKFERLSSENLRLNKHTKMVAREFLNSLQLGSFFSSADPYKPLDALLYDEISPKELATVILITNGEGLANQNKQSYFIQSWTTENKGQMSLYAVSMLEDKNLPLLDALTSLNKGKLYTSPSIPGIKRRLLKLVKTIRYPIAKDVACSAIIRSPNNNIKVYPSFQQMPALYADQPFVIMGTAQNLDDFILFIQGRQKDAWLNIKKNISFINAKNGDANLELQWVLQKSYHLYEQYFRDGDPSHLQEAGNLLNNYHLPTVF